MTCAVQVLGLFRQFSDLSLVAAQHLQGASCLHVGPAEPFSTSLVLILSFFWSYIWEEFSTLSSNPKEKVELAALSSSDDIVLF